MTEEEKFPIVNVDWLRTHDGLTLLRAIVAGEQPGPPIAKTLNFRLTEADEGRVVFKGTPQLAFYNPIGTIHGGWTSTLMDSALACAVHTTLKAGEAYTSMEYKVNFIRPIFVKTGEVACEGKLIHRGRTTATSEARLTDSGGKLLAHGIQTCAIFPFPEPR